MKNLNKITIGEISELLDENEIKNYETLGECKIQLVYYPKVCGSRAELKLKNERIKINDAIMIKKDEDDPRTKFLLDVNNFLKKYNFYIARADYREPFYIPTTFIHWPDSSLTGLLYRKN